MRDAEGRTWHGPDWSRDRRGGGVSAAPSPPSNAPEVDPRDEAPDAAPPSPGDLAITDVPRYLLSSPVPPNWIPLLPVQVQVPNPLPPPNPPGQILSRLKRGAVLQADGKTTVHAATGDVLRSVGNLLLYDEEVLREGARVTRQRRLARWTDGSTWLWTAFRNQLGQGEGSSALTFDRLLERGGTTGEE